MLQMHSTEPPIGSILAILFVAVETATDNNNQATVQNIFNLCYQQSFRAAITAGPYRDSVRKLLGAWIRRGEDFQAYQGIMLAMQYEMKDALPPAERLLKNANIQGHMKQYALVAIAKFGDESHIPLLEGARRRKTDRHLASQQRQHQHATPRCGSRLARPRDQARLQSLRV